MKNNKKFKNAGSYRKVERKSFQPCLCQRQEQTASGLRQDIKNEKMQAVKYKKKNIGKQENQGGGGKCSKNNKEKIIRKKSLPEKEFWKAGNMLYPLPAVMVSCMDGKKTNIITIAWVGTVCTNPAMVSISVRPERYSYDLIKNSGEFTINLTTKPLVRAMDFCGVQSGRDVDKWKEMHLTPGKGKKIKAPFIMESPVNIECKVEKILELGSHHMFLARVEGVHVDKELLDKKGRLCLEKAELTAYSHGFYYDLGKMAGSFGYSVKK